VTSTYDGRQGSFDPAYRQMLDVVRFDADEEGRFRLRVAQKLPKLRRKGQGNSGCDLQARDCGCYCCRCAPKKCEPHSCIINPAVVVQIFGLTVCGYRLDLPGRIPMSRE
jgi:hypothetical protein